VRLVWFLAQLKNIKKRNHKILHCNEIIKLQLLLLPTLTAVGCHRGPVILTSARIISLGLGRPTLTADGCHRGPVILTSARIGSPGPRRFPYSHCCWVPLRPSDSDFSQNWKPGTGEIPLLSLLLGATEAQWFRLQPELEAQDRGDSPTLTAVGCHWGQVIWKRNYITNHPILSIELIMSYYIQWRCKFVNMKFVGLRYVCRGLGNREAVPCDFVCRHESATQRQRRNIISISEMFRISIVFGVI
jgi:hypothetical protein